MAETTYVRHHPQKIALFLSAMRHFAEELGAKGGRILYARLDDPANTQSIPGELIRRALETGAKEVIATGPGEWRLVRALGEMPLPVTILPFNLLCRHFLNRHRERFGGNPRMGQSYRTWDRMDAWHRGRVLEGAERFLARMEAGEGV
ncbi:MAG: cryptochrome/photolyase family protein [Pseudomonadota bacterium]